MSSRNCPVGGAGRRFGFAGCFIGSLFVSCLASIASGGRTKETTQLRRTRALALAALIGWLALAAPVAATTITFDGLTGSHVPFTTYAESGFTVTVTGGIWGQGQGEGNPVPSIFTGAGAFGAPLDTLAITQDGKAFVFGGLDFAANFSNASYEFVGTLKGSTVFDLTGSQSNLTGFGDFQIVGSGVSNDLIDTLSITVNDSLSTANVDNIVLGSIAEVPDPPAMTTFATGLVLFGLWRAVASLRTRVLRHTRTISP